MKKHTRRGFTVVELVVVIAIIAVLAAVLIPTFTSIIKKANDSAYLQERTNQQIADLAEKVENLNYFTWEDFEKKLAEELAKVGSTDTAKIQAAVDAAIAKYSDSSQTGNTGLTEAQVKKIVEEAMKGQLTTAQVEAIVRQVLSGTTVSEETIRTIVNNAVKGMSTTGVTKAQVAEAVKAAISGTVAVNDAQLEAAVTKALEAFGVSTITDEQVEAIVSNLKNVIMINEESGFSTGEYTIASDKADKVYYLVTDVALDSFTITGSTDATTIIIDAPNIKNVTITGDAKVLRVLRTADESTHVKGIVTTLEVNSGRVVIEAGATVGTIKAAPAKQATVTIVLKSGSTVTDLNSEFQYYAGTNDYIKIIDEGATIENSFITSSSAVTTSTTTNVVLSGPAFVDTTTDTLKVKNESSVSANIKVNDTTYTSNGETSDLMLFAGGTGTEADPYKIASIDHFRNIYDESEHETTYYILMSDLSLGDQDYTYDTNMSFDLNKHTLTKTAGGAIFWAAGYMAVHNGDIVLTGDNSSMFGDDTGTSEIHVDDITLSGNVNATGYHYGALIKYLGNTANNYSIVSKMYIKNVTSYVNIKSSSATVGGLIGYCLNSSLSLENIAVYGNIETGNTAGGIIIGDSQVCNYGNHEYNKYMTVSNVKFYGNILVPSNKNAYYYGYQTPSGTQDDYKGDGATIVKGINIDDQLIIAEDNEFLINAEDKYNKYVIKYQFSVDYIDDRAGGYPRNITKEFTISSSDSIHTGIYKYSLMEREKGEGDTSVSDEFNMIFTHDGLNNTYCFDGQGTFMLSSNRVTVYIYAYTGESLRAVGSYTYNAVEIQ